MVPVAAQVGFGSRDRDDVPEAGRDVAVAPRTQVALQRFIGLDPAAVHLVIVKWPVREISHQPSPVSFIYPRTAQKTSPAHTASAATTRR